MQCYWGDPPLALHRLFIAATLSAPRLNCRSILVIDIPDERELVSARDDILLYDTRRVPGSISEATGSASEFKISGSYARS